MVVAKTPVLAWVCFSIQQISIIRVNVDGGGDERDGANVPYGTVAEMDWGVSRREADASCSLPLQMELAFLTTSFSM